jgi:hypothetical protein
MLRFTYVLALALLKFHAVHYQGILVLHVVFEGKHGADSFR